MKEYSKEIIICIITLLIAGGIIFYFNRSLQSEIEIENIDLYKVIPSGSEAILQFNKTSSLQRISEQNDHLKQILEKEVSPIILSILNEQDFFSQGLISFHPQGNLLLTTITRKQNKQLEKLISGKNLPAYAPQTYEKNGIHFIYYPDMEGHFFGYFYVNGLWVGSYSRKLLEEAAKLYPEESINPEIPTDSIRKRVDINSPINLYIKETLMIPDSLSIKQNNWISVDIFLSEGNTCLFTVFPFGFLQQTKADSLAMVFTAKINNLMPELTLQYQLEPDEEELLYTLCIP